MALAVNLTRCSSSRTQLPLLLLRSLNLSSSSSSPSIETQFKIPSSKDPNLPSLINLISTSKSHSKSQQEALHLLRSCPSVKPTRDLACAALWELRSDWESAVLVFRWARDCVEECGDALNLMVWVLGNERKFDLAWSLVRRMYRKSVLMAESLVILMERCHD